jgi:hypothetical protein
VVECPVETAEESHLGCDEESGEMNKVDLGMAEEMTVEMVQETWRGVQTYLVVKPEAGVQQEQHELSHSDESPQQLIATSSNIRCVGMGKQPAVVLSVLVDASYRGEGRENRFGAWRYRIGKAHRA